jgi:hypothetical protein
MNKFLISSNPHCQLHCPAAACHMGAPQDSYTILRMNLDGSASMLVLGG